MIKYQIRKAGINGRPTPDQPVASFTDYQEARNLTDHYNQEFHDLNFLYWVLPVNA